MVKIVSGMKGDYLFSSVWICLILVLLVKFVYGWFYWSKLFMDGFIGQKCLWLVLLFKIVSGWFYWSKLYLVGFDVQNCLWLVLLVKIVYGWLLFYIWGFGSGLVWFWFWFGYGFGFGWVCSGFVWFWFGGFTRVLHWLSNGRFNCVWYLGKCIPLYTTCGNN